MPTLNILLYWLLVIFSSFCTPTPCSAASGNGDTLTVGQALAVGDKLVSRNGKFALGFFQPGSGIISKYTNINTTTSPGWYLGIWYNSIPVFTVVWVANRDMPISNPKLNLTQLKISGDGNLVILNHATESVVWSTQIINKTQTSMINFTAILLNNGNFALSESPSSTVSPLWQSFDYPTNIFLPESKFGRNKVTGLNRKYISNKNLIDPGLGSYLIELDTNGAMILRSSNPSVVYWSWEGSSSAPKLVPLFNTILDMNPQTKGLINASYINNDTEEYYTYTLLNESSLIFGLLDISDQVKMNAWSQARQSWQTLNAQPAVACVRNRFMLCLAHTQFT